MEKSYLKTEHMVNKNYENKTSFSNLNIKTENNIDKHLIDIDNKYLKIEKVALPTESNDNESQENCSVTEICKLNYHKNNINVNIKMEEIDLKTECGNDYYDENTMQTPEFTFVNVNETPTETESNGASIHQMETQSKIEKPSLLHVCQICYKKYKYITRLKIHMGIHINQKQYVCNICDKSFTVKCTRDLHMRIHTTEKLYECSICNKKFNFMSNLNVHTRTHTGERPFQCSICNRKFTDSSTLSRHMRTHTGERPHSCSVCNKKFSCNSNLKAHIRTHTGEKPYECDMCNMKFHSSSNLKRHIDTHR